MSTNIIGAVLVNHGFARKIFSMRINRAIGLVLFILVAQVLLGEVLRSVSHAIIATMQTVETASQTATVQMLKVK